MGSKRLPPQAGIALAPILFIIAGIAILAAAIASGAGSFKANTGTENAKAMAENVVTECDDYKRALEYMTMNNGCDPSAIDWTPNGGGWPAGETTWTGGDFTGGNGTNRADNGQCAMFDPRGGGMIFKPLPAAALVSNPTGGYTGDGYGAAATAAYDAFAGYPFFLGKNVCLLQYGSCGYLVGSGQNNSPILLAMNYIDYNVCHQINTIANVQYSGDTGGIADPAKHSVAGAQAAYPFGMFAGNNLRTAPANSGLLGEPILSGPGPTQISGYLQACGYDGQSTSTPPVYLYICALMAR